MQGWIKMHRKFTEWEWYDDINVKILFLHLLLTVNHVDKNWRGRQVKSGERITSLKKLADELHLSLQQVRTAIGKLELTGEVTRKATNEYTHIVLINWGEYQKMEKSSTRKSTNEQQTSNKRVTTTKECKNEKNVKKEEENSVALHAPTPSQIAKDFFSPESDRTELIAYFTSKGISEETIKHELSKFVMYWTEPTRNGKKERWETHKTFEVRRRLFTWFNNANKSYSRSQETKGITL